MENKDNNIIEITSHSGFIVSDESILDEHYTKNPKVTNPIAKNFSKLRIFGGFCRINRQYSL